jgi:hypothetical protein
MKRNSWQMHVAGLWLSETNRPAGIPEPHEVMNNNKDAIVK